MKGKLAVILPALMLGLPIAVRQPPGLAGQAPQASSPNPTKVKAEIRDAIRQRLAALRSYDRKAYAGFFAGDCFVTGDAGERIKPEEIAASWSRDSRSGISYHGSDVLELEVHAYVDIAIAAYRLELDEDWSGQKQLGSSRHTDVFARRG